MDYYRGFLQSRRLPAQGYDLSRIDLTTPDGRKFEVDPAAIEVLVEAEPGEWAAGVKSIVYTNVMKQGVRETIDQIKLLETAHAQTTLHRSHQSPRPSSRPG